MSPSPDADTARELRLARARLAYIASHGGAWERSVAQGAFDPLLLRAVEAGASLAAPGGPSGHLSGADARTEEETSDGRPVDPGAS